MSVVINGVKLKNATCNGEKVKKIYYNDGTTSNLIYSAEENILSKFSASDFYHPNGSYAVASINSDGSLQFNASSYICRNIWTPAIDLSQYSTLSVTYTVTASSKPAGYDWVQRFYVLANGSNTFSADFSMRSDLYNVSTLPRTSYYKIYSKGGGNSIHMDLTAGSTYTQTIDISGWNSNLKIGLANVCGNQNTLTMKVTSIILS